MDVNNLMVVLFVLLLVFMEAALEIWTRKKVECYTQNLMGCPRRNLEDSHVDTKADRGCLAHKMSERTNDCTSNWQRGHPYDSLARIWLNSVHVLKTFMNPNLNIRMIQFLCHRKFQDNIILRLRNGYY